MYDIILKKNVIDIAQVEDAEACIVALRKITKRPEEVEFICKCLKNLTIFKKDSVSGNKKDADLSKISQIFDNPHSVT